MFLNLLITSNKAIRRRGRTFLYLLVGWLAAGMTPGFAAADPIRIEAEAAQGVTLNGVQIAATPAGFSGTGYAWGFDDANGADNIVFTIPSPVTAGEYELTIGYYSPYGDKTTRLTVNGATSEHVLKLTGTTFSAVTVGKFQLTAGTNTVTLAQNWGYYGIDYIVLTPAAVKPPTIVPLVNGRIEAELGDLTGVEAASANTGFSGTGYVTGFDNATDKLTLTFNAPAGLYEVAMGYASPFGEKTAELTVNEDGGSALLTQTLSGFSSKGVGRFLLKEGLNTITIYRGWGYYDVDYLQLTPTVATLPTKPPKTLVDVRATLSTTGLFSYIVDQYGSKTISGQQDDVEYVLEKTGKEPAIGSFDLMDYSPSRVQFGTNPGRPSEAIINWAKKGEGQGIVSLMWHWNAPTDLINQAPDKLWWRGFYTDATTFDIAAVLADKNGERYQLLLRDMDAIALQLKKFQTADVPVLWRPLHEAPGGWFWWGAKGSGPFKELWRIMYDRMTNYHQLHNLIWVYTSTDTFNADWYPGDEYVDMVGMDIYASASSNMSSNWASAQAQLNGKKLVALSETGNPPNMAKVRGFATWWSWFSTWTGDYIRNQPVDALTALFNDADVITRDELPNWRPAVTLKVQYQDSDNGQVANNNVKPNLTLTNEGPTAVPYSELTARYWLTTENYAGINTWIDYAEVGSSKVKMKYVPLENPRNGATGYVEYSFDPSAGTLAANGSSGPIQSRFANADWANLSETNDYSYRTAAQYALNDRITLYRTAPGGVPQLIWGTEPDVVAPVTKLTVYARNKNDRTNGNSISTQLQVVNEGNVPVAYGDLSVRYWFTAEGTQSLNYWIDYAKLGNGNLTGQFVRNVGRSKADTYFELKVKPTVGTLYPSAGTGDIQYRIAKADWSAFDEINDYSYEQTAPLDTNGHITVYHKGRLVFGTEPAATASGRLANGELTTPLQVTVLGNPVVGDNAEVEVRGAEGSQVKLLLIDEKGGKLLERKTEQASAIVSYSLPLSKTPGIYFLQVSTPTDAVTVKVVRP
ncbi:glycosyl hydrolase [Spirosoma arcticum]